MAPCISIRKVERGDKPIQMSCTTFLQMGDKEAKSVSDVKPGGCHFYLSHKRRYCKFPPPDGEEYCLQHIPLNECGQVRALSTLFTELKYYPLVLEL